MAYLRNTWYCAAWSAEVGAEPMVRRLLDEQVLLFRDEEGTLVAASDLCPHRFAPLHLGKVVDGAIECPYHGLRFNGQGRCVYNPDGDGRIPAGARLKTYPIVERWNAAWIWMGDPAKADPDLIHAYEFLDDPAHYRPVTGLLHVRANYRYINDNIMDQAHLHMVHHDTLACDSMRRAKTELVRDDKGTIWTNRLGVDGAVPAVFQTMWRLERGEEVPARMDHWAESGWNVPSLVRNNTGVAPHGRPREEGLETKNAHFLTPETDKTTHYFWAIVRNFDLDNPTMDSEIRTGTEYAFVEEDEVMLHGVQEAMGDRDFWSMKPALLAGDVGAVELRRTLDKLIAAEQAEPTRQQVPEAKAALQAVG